jgi:hypothetical protein
LGAIDGAVSFFAGEKLGQALMRCCEILCGLREITIENPMVANDTRGIGIWIDIKDLTNKKIDRQFLQSKDLASLRKGVSMIKNYRMFWCVVVLALLATLLRSGWGFSYRAGVPLAGRYHQLQRTTNFFERSKSADVSKESAPVKSSDKSKSEKALDKKGVEKDRLASRYHLQGRTTAFFQRAVG